MIIKDNENLKKYYQKYYFSIIYLRIYENPINSTSNVKSVFGGINPVTKKIKLLISGYKSNTV